MLEACSWRQLLLAVACFCLGLIGSELLRTQSISPSSALLSRGGGSFLPDSGGEWSGLNVDFVSSRVATRLDLNATLDGLRRGDGLLGANLSELAARISALERLAALQPAVAHPAQPTVAPPPPPPDHAVSAITLPPPAASEPPLPARGCTGKKSNVKPDVNFDRYQEPRFTLKHLSKAGGTYAKMLLKEVVDPGHWQVNCDDCRLPLEFKEKHFVAIMLRNPCDWYVSYANFCPTKAFGYHRPTFAPDPFPRGHDVSKLGPLTNEEFKLWTTSARWPDGFGFLSYYLWMATVAPECWLWHIMKDNIEIKDHKSLPEGFPSAGRCSNATRMRTDLAEVSAQEMAHCYVFHETFEDDMRRCLQAYERSSAFAKGSVDWTKFDALAQSTSLQEQLYAKNGFTSESKSVATSWRRHRSCEQHFPPAALEEQWLRESDAYLFEKFGYSSCCRPSEGIWCARH